MSQIARFINAFIRTLLAPFVWVQRFVRSDPAAQSARLLRSQGQRLRYLGSLSGQLAQRLIPRRFKVAYPADDRRALPGKDAAQAGEFGQPAQRRIRELARRAAFSQIHLVARESGQRLVLHIGSATGESFAEVILNDGTPQAAQLRFQLADENVYGAPLLLRVASASQETVVTVDNTVATPEAPLADGAVLDVNGRLYDVQLYAFGNLPAVTRVDAAWATDVGPNNDKNQDAVGIYQHPKAYMFTVADGVGGGYAGEEVSEFSVKYLLSVFRQNIQYDQFSWYEVYAKAFEYINAEVRNFVEVAPSAAGTTLTSVFIRNWTAYIAHVGDSRLYHLRGNDLRQVTTDHNQEREIDTRNRAGMPTRVKRTVLQKAIGKADSIQPEIQTLALQPKDRLLLTTDGVTNQINHDELYDLITSLPPSQIPIELVALANARNNTDNATVVLIDVMSEAYDRDVWLAEPQDRVYVGGPAWYLKLSGPAATNTAHAAARQLGCWLLLVLVVGGGLLWGGYQARAFFGSGNDTAAEMRPSQTVEMVITPAETTTQPLAAPTSTVTAEEATLPVGVETALPPTELQMEITATSTLPPTRMLVPTSTLRPS